MPRHLEKRAARAEAGPYAPSQEIKGTRAQDPESRVLSPVRYLPLGSPWAGPKRSYVHVRGVPVVRAWGDTRTGWVGGPGGYTGEGIARWVHGWGNTGPLDVHAVGPRAPLPRPYGATWELSGPSSPVPRDHLPGPLPGTPQDQPPGTPQNPYSGPKGRDSGLNILKLV